MTVSTRLLFCDIIAEPCVETMRCLPAVR
jgi:hypothetical protein